MKKTFDFVLVNGRGMPNVSVSVYNYGTLTLATLWADSAGTIPLVNPVTTVANGYYEFYVADGRYSIGYSGTGVVSSELTDLIIDDTLDLSSTAVGKGASLVTFESGKTVQDLASSALGDGATLVGINDAGSKFTGTTVEAALQETRTSAELGAVTGAGLIGINDTGGKFTGLTVEAALQETRTAAELSVVGGAALVGADDGSSGSLWTTVQGFITRLGTAFRSQIAGGIISAGRSVICGYTGNAIAADIGTATISGGGLATRENIIGGDGSLTVNTANPNVTSVGTSADYSVITGGYDNVAGGLASHISGFHNYTGVGTTHGTISGGSVHKITAGDYNSIGGGTQNTISGGTSYGRIGGGGLNTINVAAGQDYATLGGGYNNTTTARYSFIGGGTVNAASGVSSTISGGQNGTASGAQSTVAGGDTNTAGGIASFAGGGFTNTLSATAARSDYSGTVGGYQNNIGTASAARFSGALGGRANSIQGEYSFTLGGYSCQATAEGCGAMGYGAVASHPGQLARASGYFSVAGDAQGSQSVMRRQTTDATVTELRSGSALGNRLTLSNDSVYAFDILVVGRNVASDVERAAYSIKGCIAVSSAGSTALVGTPAVTILAEDIAAWDANVAADVTNKALQINVTGEAAKTINWVADVRLVKVIG